MIDGLEPEALYSISVVAYTVKGDGVHSKALLIKTPAAREYLCVRGHGFDSRVHFQKRMYNAMEVTLDKNICQM